jgi:hypothetical protein
LQPHTELCAEGCNFRKNLNASSWLPSGAADGEVAAGETVTVLVVGDGVNVFMVVYPPTLLAVFQLLQSFASTVKHSQW